MYCTEFIFDGISSKEYDLTICSFDRAEGGEAAAGSRIEFTNFKAPGSDRWVKTGSAYNEPLTFTFQICKDIGGGEKSEPLSERELAFLMRWLVRKEYKDLQFIQEGYENIFYHCQINAERYMITGECYGLTLTVLCDAPYGWSEVKTATISSSGTTIVKLYDSSDEIGVVYPSVTLHVNENAEAQDVSIANALTGIATQIKNCNPGEIITMENRKISSSHFDTEEHKTLYDDFNWRWFTIGNTFENRENEITVTGNCDITMKWRVPRKAVI